MILQVISASGGSRVEVVAESRPTPARCYASAVKLIVGVVHLIDAECGFKAALVECLVVRYQWQALDQRLNLRPHIGENRGILGVGGAKAVDLTASEAVVFRLRLY